MTTQVQCTGMKSMVPELDEWGSHGCSGCCIPSRCGQLWQLLLDHSFLLFMEGGNVSVRVLPEDAPEDSTHSVRTMVILLSEGGVAMMQWNWVHRVKQVSMSSELTWIFGETILYVQMTNWNSEKLAILTKKLQTCRGKDWWSWKTAEVRALQTLWCTAQAFSSWGEIQASWDPPHYALRATYSSGI